LFEDNNLIYENLTYYQTMQDTLSFLEVLVQRGEFLVALSDGPQSKQDISDSLDVSRSTARRGLNELSAADLVVQSDDEYELTGFGQLALEQLQDTVSLFGQLLPVTDYLGTIPLDDIPTAFFSDANIYSPETHSPYKPAWTLKDLIDDSDAFVYSVDKNSEVYMDIFHDAVVDNDADVVVVVTDEVATEILNGYPEANETAEQLDRWRMLVKESHPSYGVGVVSIDGELFGVLAIHDEHGMIEVLAVNDGLAVEWALSTFVYHYHRADPLRSGTPPRHAGAGPPGDAVDELPPELVERMPPQVLENDVVDGSETSAQLTDGLRQEYQQILPEAYCNDTGHKR
jgi:predicted transcriptional regulator